MFIPTHLVTPHTDLMLQDTRRNGRPLTRWEITQQASRHDRLVAPYLHRAERETRHDTPPQARLGGIRPTIARMLVRAGERPAPPLASSATSARRARHSTRDG